MGKGRDESNYESNKDYQKTQAYKTKWIVFDELRIKIITLKHEN